MADHLPRALWAANFLAAYVFSRLFCRALHRRIHGHGHGHEGTALVAGLERDSAVAECKQGMVLAHADAFARIEFGAALAHDHIAARHGFAAEQLDAQHLGIGVATVARGTAGFLMRHDLLLAAGIFAGADTEHLHGGEVLAVAALAMSVLAALLLEGDDLVALAVFQDLALDRSALDQRRADLWLVAAQHQDLKVELGADLAHQAFDLQDGVLGHFILFSAGADDRVHGLNPCQ